MYILYKKQENVQEMRPDKTTVICVCSHGGHLVEMLEILDGFKDHDVYFFTYEEETTKELPNAYFFENFAKKPMALLSVAFKMFRLLLKIKPAIIVSTGAELAIPALYISRLFPGQRRIYMECSAQVFSPSLTGRLVYPVSDLFIVQWKTLLARYGKKARYVGGLI
jgi:beta-1,4-N-acetylglucosaminyltransferase